MTYIGLILLIVFSVVDPGGGPGGRGDLVPPFFFFGLQSPCFEEAEKVGPRRMVGWRN